MIFSHLHCHTQFSLLDGAASIPALFKKAAADGMGKSLWAKQVGERAKRLADMMKDG